MKIKAFLNKNSMRFTLLFALVSLELLMSFSFLGYLHIEPISITFAFIPVVLAGAILGIPDAIIIGAVFGLASMWKAGVHYVQYSDQLFSPFMSGYPIESLLLSVGSRMLFGLVIGVLFFIAKRLPFTWLWITLTAFMGRLLHSILVYSCMGLLFPQAGYSTVSAFQNFGNANDLLTSLLTALIVLLAWRLEKSNLWQNFCLKIQKVQSRQWGGHYYKQSTAGVILLAILFSMFVGIYFVNRMEYALGRSGIILSAVNYADLMHLQVQFLIGVLSIMMLLAIFLSFTRQYATYMTLEADVDQLTGILTRTAFFRICQKSLSRISTGEKNGYFIMADIDHFKKINDFYGHQQGDQALREVAQQLQGIFGQYGSAGRLGGDEFAVLLQPSISEAELERNLELFLKNLRNIHLDGHTLTCSVGVVPIVPGKTIDELYREADDALYDAKQQGRDRYVFKNSKTTILPEKISLFKN